MGPRVDSKGGSFLRNDPSGFEELCVVDMNDYVETIR
jgi:hypothetical protein